jgi:hypothetical protein
LPSLKLCKYLQKKILRAWEREGKTLLWISGWPLITVAILIAYAFNQLQKQHINVLKKLWGNAPTGEKEETR